MSKNKIIAIITSTILLGAVASTTFTKAVKNITPPKTTNEILLAAPTLKNLAVVINTEKNPLVLYSEPSLNANISSYISVGEMLNYQKTNNPNFYKVTVQETGATGYISATNIQIIESGINQAYTAINRAGTIINVSTDVKLMSAPSTHSQILGSYKNNTNIKILGKQGQWYKVEAGTQLGYMYQSYVGILNNSSTTTNNNTNNTNNTNSTNISSNSNKQITVSEKMVTPNGTVVLPEKIVYSGSNYNPENIKNMTLPNGYELCRFNVYNNGNMIETGGTDTTNLAGVNLKLPSLNHLSSGNLVIEYIVEKSTNSNANANSSSKTIQIINYTPSQFITPNDIVVKNQTGHAISNSQLISVIKNWILEEQYSYSGFYDCNGTMWSKHWLDNIPESQLINYFIEANGQAALSTNITASELNKTAVASLAFAKAHPNPFTEAQAKEYITQMLKQSNPNQVITKITFQGSQSQGGDYAVYTKQGGNKEPFWYVESWIGYATGV